MDVGRWGMARSLWVHGHSSRSPPRLSCGGGGWTYTLRLFYDLVTFLSHQNGRPPMSIKSASLFLAACVCLAVPARAEEPLLLGELGGIRPALAEKGVDLALVYKGDFWNVASGGLNTGSNYLDNLDIQFSVDGEKLAGWKGASAYVSFINNFGGRPNAMRVGAVQGLDNIETPVPTFKLYEAWVEQALMEGKLSILLGLRDLNAEFYQTDAAGGFIGPVYGIGQDMAQAGRGGPSIFPTTALAARARFALTDAGYVQAAVFNGQAGNPDKPHGTHIRLSAPYGYLLVAEGGLTQAAGEKYALGAWTYTGNSDDLTDTSGGLPTQRKAGGFYALLEREVYSSKEGGAIQGFLRLGFADRDTLQTDWSYNMGLVGTGWIPPRPEAEIGAGIAQAHNGRKHRATTPSDTYETSLEVYYRDTLFHPALHVQPDVQYIVNPGTDPAVRDALALGLRIEAAF
jgi:porin